LVKTGKLMWFLEEIEDMTEWVTGIKIGEKINEI